MFEETIMSDRLKMIPMHCCLLSLMLPGINTPSRQTSDTEPLPYRQENSRGFNDNSQEMNVTT